METSRELSVLWDLIEPARVTEVATMRARDVMTGNVITIRPEMRTDDARALLLHYRIHGAPVTDDTGRLLGVVSLVDLAGRFGGTVRDVMTAEAVSVSGDTPLREIAAVMLDRMVRRVIVTRGDRVVGIVSASDVMRAFLGAQTAAAGPPGGTGGSRLA